MMLHGEKKMTKAINEYVVSCPKEKENAWKIAKQETY